VPIKLRMSSMIAALAAVVLTANPAPLSAAGFETAPHRAVYEFKLKSARRDSGIVDIRGGMTYEIVDACDGWTVNQKIVLGMINRQNRQIRSVTSYSSWESKDGRRFRFNSRTLRNGRLSEQYRGTATLARDGSGGEAVFTRPKLQKMKLARGAIFPTAHSELVMKLAQKGERFVWRVLFDGTTNEGPYGVSAWMGKPRGTGAGDEIKVQQVVGDRLGVGKFWAVKLAFFPSNSRASAPEYALNVAMHPNSVARWLTMDYGNFVIYARLMKMQALAKASC